jgi:hypothetical protein
MEEQGSVSTRGPQPMDCGPPTSATDSSMRPWAVVELAHGVPYGTERSIHDGHLSHMWHKPRMQFRTRTRVRWSFQHAVVAGSACLVSLRHYSYALAWKLAAGGWRLVMSVRVLCCFACGRRCRLSRSSSSSRSLASKIASHSGSAPVCTIEGAFLAHTSSPHRRFNNACSVSSLSQRSLLAWQSLWKPGGPL